MTISIDGRIAQELAVHEAQVAAAAALLDEGATVPFIARYRKEATDGLDDTQLRDLEARLGYLRELEERRAAVLKSVDDAAASIDLTTKYKGYKKERQTAAVQVIYDELK